MINSNSRKLILSGWMQENNETEYNTSLKLQKFLFMYEMLSDLNENDGDFENLQGWKDGPVFATVYGDYTYRKEEFSSRAIDLYKSSKEKINEKYVKLANFIVSIMNCEELSQFTHGFNIWKHDEKLIATTKNHKLDKENISDDDRELLKTLENSYSLEYIDSVEIIKIRKKVFLIPKEKVKTLSDEQRSTLEVLADMNDLINPVYIEIDDDGVLLVD